jgi:hypothetical protein
MELVLMLSALWRLRVLLAMGMTLAVTAGFAVGPHPAPDRGVASSRLMLDTPDSQVVNADPEGLDSLTWRAALIVHLVSSVPVRTRIASDLGIPPEQLAVVDPALDKPQVATTLPVAASEAAAIRPEPYSITVRSDPYLPIITVEAHAADRRRATRLANAATRELVSSGSSINTPDLQGFAVKRIAPTQAATVPGSRGLIPAIGAATVVLGLWCGTFILVWLIRRRRSGGVRPGGGRGRPAPSAAS